MSDSPDILMWMRFIGPELDSTAIPIDVLGESLQAIQQIIYKAARWDYIGTADNDDQITLVYSVRQINRDDLALQLKYHGSGSDLYGLGPLVVDPQQLEIIYRIIPIVIRGLLDYADKRVFRKAISQTARQPVILDQKIPVENNQRLFSQSILSDVAKLVKHIDSQGRITQIEMARTPKSEHVVVRFDESDKLYIKRMRKEITEGEWQEIMGIVTAIDLENYEVIIRLVPAGKKNLRQNKSRSKRPGRKVIVIVSPHALENILNKVDAQPVVQFKGWPRGTTQQLANGAFKKFIAESFELVPEEHSHQ